jgi:hypothetical protein
LGNVSRERVVDHRTEPGGDHLSSSEGFDEIEYRVGNLAPVLRTPLDSPYEISNELFAALRHVLHDVGGQPDLPQPYREKVEEEWEMNSYITCECLGWRGVWNSEERRRAENDLGATLYFGLPYYARWATVAAKVLINTGRITLTNYPQRSTRSGHGWTWNRHEQSIRDRRPCHRQERHIDVPHPHPGVRTR